ncbi:MAG: 1-deoxy-D-xylulose-5-phosphate reductoisomerase [Limnochordaceae bacterium]|nr:1-deoxy-D-xylulose-5-phosphate reductoisomerase [Limnochordaceae bacterium]
MENPPVRVALLGSTGSIGRQTLDVIERLNQSDGPHFQVVALAARHHVSTLAEQVRRYRPHRLAVTDPAAWAAWGQNSPDEDIPALGPGDEALSELATADDVDLVVVSVVGAAGLKPTLAALAQGKTVALANKETLVIGGHLVAGLLLGKESSGEGLAGSRLRPIDSEHSAIWQSLGGCQGWDGTRREPASNVIRRLILTASGGPFRHTPLDEFDTLTPEQALRHPNWKMGARITVDSATMMNKGFEIIEAAWLFGVSPEQVQVVIHPQAAIHSLAEMGDGALLAQLGPADMRLPIEYALCFPRRGVRLIEPLNLVQLGRCDFEAVDPSRYPALGVAREVARQGGTLPAVLNAADEEAVAAFLAGRIRFPDIARLVEQAVTAHQNTLSPSLEEVLAADQWARRQVRERLRSA